MVSIDPRDLGKTSVQESIMRSMKPRVLSRVLCWVTMTPKRCFTNSLRRAFKSSHVIVAWLIFLSLALPLVEVSMSETPGWAAEIQGLASSTSLRGGEWLAVGCHFPDDLRVPGPFGSHRRNLNGR